MKLVLSSDEPSPVIDFILGDVAARGHEIIYVGPTAGQGRQGETADADDDADWPVVTLRAVSQVAAGEADEAIVLCWTGTGASIAANKVHGIRAALCQDAETAKGARIWNHANVLALSLRATSIPVAKEILDAWFETPYSDDAWNVAQIDRIKALESEGNDPRGG